MTYSLLADIIPGPFDEIGGVAGLVILVSIVGGVITTFLNRIFDVIDSKMGVKKNKNSTKYNGKNDVERNLETVSRVYDMQSKQAQFQRDKEDYEHKKKERELDLAKKKDDLDWEKQKRYWEFEKRSKNQTDREKQIEKRSFADGYQAGRDASNIKKK